MNNNNVNKVPVQEPCSNISKDCTIPKELYDKLVYLGIIDTSGIRNHNVGKSNYSAHLIQPWAIWLDYPNLTPWDDDVIKRILRDKEEPGMTWIQSRALDYEKIIHICRERLRQLDIANNTELLF